MPTFRMSSKSDEKVVYIFRGDVKVTEYCNLEINLYIRYPLSNGNILSGKIKSFRNQPMSRITNNSRIITDP